MITGAGKKVIEKNGGMEKGIEMEGEDKDRKIRGGTRATCGKMQER